MFNLKKSRLRFFQNAKTILLYYLKKKLLKKQLKSKIKDQDFDDFK